MIDNLLFWLKSEEERKELLKAIKTKSDPPEIKTIKKNYNWILEPDNILFLYTEKQISKDYAIYLLKVLLEWEFNSNPLERKQYELWKKETGSYLNTEMLMRVIGHIVKISGIKPELFDYLRDYLISTKWNNLTIELMNFISKLFPHDCKAVITHLLENNESLCLTLSYRYRNYCLELSNFIQNQNLKEILQKKTKWPTRKKHIKHYFELKKSLAAI